MKLISIETIFVFFLLTGSLNCDKENDDNDFAEFEDFDTDDLVKVSSDRNDLKQKSNGADQAQGFGSAFMSDENDDDGVVVDEDNEFDHFSDEEEFEGFNRDSSAPPVFDQKTGEPKLTVAKVPLHFG